MAGRTLTVVAVVCAWCTWVVAQEPSKLPPMHRVGGARDGASAFRRVDYPQVKPKTPGEIDFAHYHTYDETAALLRAWAAKYPDLVDLYSVGQSFEGREIWQVTIANKKNLKHTDRPAFFIEGGRHAGEISGIEATLYLHQPRPDPLRQPIRRSRRLVDTKTIYARPMNNPDGSSLYHLTAQTLRSTVRPNDSDGDGLLDEDAGEDLDGDGFIRQMRKIGRQGQGELDQGSEGREGTRDAPRPRRRRRLRGLLGRGRQRRRRPLQRGRHRRPRPAPQLPGELAADARGDRPRPDAGRRRRVPALGARNAGGVPVPHDAPQHRHRQVARHRRADDPARALDEQERGDDVPGGSRVDPQVRCERAGDHQLSVGRGHLRCLRDTRRRRIR